MLVFNFSHPLSQDAQAQLGERYGELEIRMVRVHLDMQSPLASQVAAIVDSCGLTPQEWQTKPFLVVLPGASIAAGLVLAEIHGRSGGFPLVASLVSGEDRVFRLAEVIDLSQVRNTARTRR